MAKIEKGPNWEDDLGGEFDKLAKDKNFDNIQKAMYSQFENLYDVFAAPVRTLPEPGMCGDLPERCDLQA
ncbi:respiratory nitrate reductase 1 subunit beta [Escherichia coli]|nr:respiratory nitrate reductase 1 subunit beta [Escherichia coli]